MQASVMLAVHRLTARLEVLAAFHQMAFHHHAKDVIVAGGHLC